MLRSRKNIGSDSRQILVWSGLLLLLQPPSCVSVGSQQSTNNNSKYDMASRIARGRGLRIYYSKLRGVHLNIDPYSAIRTRFRRKQPPLDGCKTEGKEQQEWNKDDYEELN